MKVKFLSENDLKIRDRSTGHFYFSESTMQGFKGKLHSNGYPIATNKGIVYLFVDSVKYGDNPRNYRITLMTENGDTCSTHLEFNRPSQANSYLTQMLPDRAKKYPAWLVWFAFRMVTKYDIRGICDFVYIMNITALETNTGDGQSTFWLNTSDTTKFETVANKLNFAYASNIPQNSEELIISELQMSQLD